MKKDSSIKNITIAAIKRSAMEIDTWTHSRIIKGDSIDFELNENELPVFEIKSEQKHTVITTRKIIERHNDTIKSIDFGFIDDVVYGNFKGRPNSPELTIFRIIDIHGDDIDFQMETGSASIGLIKSVNTILNLKRE